MIRSNKDTELIDALQTLHPQGEVIEVRIPNTSQGTVSGYFDDYRALTQAVIPYNGKYDIYCTLNPVEPSLLARCQNHLGNYAKHTTSDKDIQKLSILLIDLDPIRPSGISSTSDEKSHAEILAGAISSDLLEAGFPEPIVGDSGNGYHLLFKIDLENTAPNVALLKNFLAALHFRYSNEHVEVDLTTYNPARIAKLYGTMACKGDNTVERPHRRSRLIDIPEKIVPVMRNQLESIARQLPQKEDGLPQKTNGNPAFDLEDWIKGNDLKVAIKAPYQGGTKYILETCPWNEAHKNHSAYIIQFGNGAIAAGCLHNSCRDQSWKTLRALFETEPSPKSSVAGETQSDIMINLAGHCQFFKNDLEELYAAAPIDGHWEVMAIKSRRFHLYVTKLFFDETGSAPGKDAIAQAMSVLEMRACFSPNEYKLQRRIASHEGCLFYDLGDPDWRSLNISQFGAGIATDPPILFLRKKGMGTQLIPDFQTPATSLPQLCKSHFRFKRDEDSLLFMVYLVTCFLPDIAHVILVLFGEKGAAKTTTMKMLKKIVDPGIPDLLSMPSSKQDLAFVLSNTYMPIFDNLDTLSAEKSDMLCMAATGGAFSKRTLYTDSDETVLSLKRCVALNGINVVATRADLLDRSIVLELDRISKNERKTEQAILETFEQDLPRILGAVFNALSQAMSMRGNVELDQVGRMADFTYWGYAIAEALEIGGEEFLSAYLNNQDRANTEALAAHPVAAAVQALLKRDPNWSGSVSSLLKVLEGIAGTESISTHVRSWPKDANVLSRRLKEVKSNLEEIGIFFDIRHSGDCKTVTFEKTGGNSPLTNEDSDSGSLLNVSDEAVDDGFDDLF